MKLIFKLTLIFSILLTSCSSDNKTDDSSANNIDTPKSSEINSNTDDNLSSKNNSTVSGEKITIPAEDMSIENSQIVDLPFDRLNASMEKLLSKKNKSLGTVNNDGTIYIISTSSSVIPSNKNGFINSRNIAFAKAELRAKMAVLQLAGEVVTTERNSTLIANSISGNDPDASSTASVIDKAAKVVDKSLDKALMELGMSSNEINSMNQKQKEKTYNETYQDYISSYVAGMLKGISVVKIVEGEVGSNDYEVAVCVKYSPENQSLAANIKNLGAIKSTLNSETLSKIKSMSAEKLISKMGAQFFKDENGNRFVLGFGQASVRKTQKRQSNFVGIARKKARLKAVNNIKNLLAEGIIAKEIQSNTEKYSEFTDGAEGIYTEDNYSELIKSKRSTIEMNNLTVRNWDGIHPVSNQRIIGSIVILTEANNINFETKKNSNNTKGTNTTKSKYIESEEIEGEDI